MKVRWTAEGYDTPPGTILDVSQEQGESLIAHGFAEAVTEDKKPPKGGGS